MLVDISDINDLLADLHGRHYAEELMIESFSELKNMGEYEYQL
jgi:hypothetical protein